MRPDPASLDTSRDDEDETEDSRRLILHWDGSAWSHVVSPSPAPYDELLGVTDRRRETRGGRVRTSCTWELVRSPHAPGSDHLVLAQVPPSKRELSETRSRSGTRGPWGTRGRSFIGRSVAVGEPESEGTGGRVRPSWPVAAHQPPRRGAPPGGPEVHPEDRKDLTPPCSRHSRVERGSGL